MMRDEQNRTVSPLPINYLDRRQEDGGGLA